MEGCTYLGPDYDPLTWHTEHPGQGAPYCGCDTVPGKSYCSEHYPVVYATGTALRKRHRDLKRRQTIEDLQQMIIEIAEELEDEGWQPELGWEEPDSLRER